ncbi:unnamed protein product [Ceratitis capitata]|uniref:(Mediterranean fruit fly) hypothetical protein n=1 Tax=Ceratitis capitata TaxID=7213 RepID=A0A811UXM0_CERCA|nr:unnamed protein product [Ceratitis capitata]
MAKHLRQSQMGGKWTEQKRKAETQQSIRAVTTTTTTVTSTPATLEMSLSNVTNTNTTHHTPHTTYHYQAGAGHLAQIHTQHMRIRTFERKKSVNTAGTPLYGPPIADVAFTITITSMPHATCPMCCGAFQLLPHSPPMTVALVDCYCCQRGTYGDCADCCNLLFVIGVAVVSWRTAGAPVYMASNRISTAATVSPIAYNNKLVQMR